MTDRVVAFAIQGDGSRSFGLVVNGLRVLVTASEGRHDAGRELADVIAAIGPEMGPDAVIETPAPVVASAPERPTKRRQFTVGQRVWCNVTAIRKWCTVTEIGTGRNSGRIKISGERAWCPVYNFDESAPNRIERCIARLEDV